MPRCIGHTKIGHQCRNNAHPDNGTRCKTHHGIFLRNEPLIQVGEEARAAAVAGGAQLCTATKKSDGSACLNTAKHGTLCGVHDKSAQHAALREERRERRFRIIDMYWNQRERGKPLHDLLAEWITLPNARELGIPRLIEEVGAWIVAEKQRFLWRMFQQDVGVAALEHQVVRWMEIEDVTPLIAGRLLFMIRQWVNFHGQWGRAAERPVPTNPLGRFATDTQNVHTQEAAVQMRDGMAILLSAEKMIVHGTQQTYNEVKDAFTKLNPEPVTFRNVMGDIKHWHNMNTVTNENDWLFRRMLRGLWFTIKKFEGDTYDELVKRLWQESCDSVGMCAQGHLSRLTNVMIGFDDAFKPTVSTGEQLQQKMAAIAGMEGTEEEKVAMARGVLAELKIPEDQHSAWLEAF